jgi:hypothetical protein
MSPVLQCSGVDAFNPSHPVLNFREVVVRRRLLHGSDCGMDDLAIIEWRRLTWEERLELERLLAKACS